MSLMDSIASDDILFFGDFSQTVTYRNIDIQGVVEKGVSLDAGNIFQGSGRSSRAKLWVQKKDVQYPHPGDTVIIENVTWQVAEIIESMEGMHYLNLISQENPY